MQMAREQLLNANEISSLMAFAKQWRARRRTAALRREGPLPIRRRGWGMETDESRPYQMGDDPRHIDWRATARSQRPMTKTFHDEKATHAWIWLDRGPYMAFGSQHETKIVCASRVAVFAAFATVLRQGDVNGVLCENGHAVIPRLRGIDGALRFMAPIVAPLATQSQRYEPVAALDDMLSRLDVQSTVLMISDFAWLKSEHGPRIAHLCQQRAVIATHIFDPAENQLPARGRWRLQDPQSGRQIVINAGDTRLRERFQLAVDERNELIKSLWQRHGATYLPLATGGHHLDTVAAIL